MTFRYVKIANGVFAGQSVPVAEVTQKILDERRLDSEVRVFPDDHEEDCLLIDIPEAVKESLLVEQALEKFKDIRNRKEGKKILSLHALEQFISRLIPWCRQQEYEVRLRFIRAAIREMLGNHMEALSDLNKIMDVRDVLNGYPEFDYLVNHNRAVLMILQSKPEGIAALFDMYNAYCFQDDEESEKSTDGNDTCIGLPTIIVIHEILEKLERLARSDSTYKNIALSNLDKNVLRKMAFNSRVGKKYDKSSIYQVWRRDLLVWPHRQKIDTDNHFLGLALFLDVDRHEDQITKVLTEARKGNSPEMYFCIRGYQSCLEACGRGEFFPGLKYFLDTRNRQFSHPTLAQSREISRLRGRCHSRLSQCLNETLNSCGNQLNEIQAKRFRACGEIEKEIIDLLNRQFDILEFGGKQLLAVLHKVDTVEDCERLSRMLHKYSLEYIRFQLFRDLLEKGCYQQRQSLFSEGLDDIREKIYELGCQWNQRVSCGEGSWGITSPIRVNGAWLQGGWAVLMVEYCLHHLKTKFALEKESDENVQILCKCVKTLIDEATWNFDLLEGAKQLEKEGKNDFRLKALIAETTWNFERVKRSGRFEEGAVDFASLEKATLSLIDNIKNMIRMGTDLPDSPDFIVELAEACLSSVKEGETLRFPGQHDEIKRQAVSCLLNLFDHNYPEDISLPCSFFSRSYLGNGFEVLKKVDQLGILVQGDPLYCEYLERMGRILTMEGLAMAQSSWQRGVLDFEPKKEDASGKDTPKASRPDGQMEEESSLAEQLLVKVLTDYHPNAPYALWGLAYLETQRTDLRTLVKNDLLRVLGYSATNLQEIDSQEKLREHILSAGDQFLKDEITPERCDDFKALIQRLLNEGQE